MIGKQPERRYPLPDVALVALGEIVLFDIGVKTPHMVEHEGTMPLIQLENVFGSVKIGYGFQEGSGLIGKPDRPEAKLCVGCPAEKRQIRTCEARLNPIGVDIAVKDHIAVEPDKDVAVLHALCGVLWIEKLPAKLNRIKAIAVAVAMVFISPSRHRP